MNALNSGRKRRSAMPTGEPHSHANSARRGAGELEAEVLAALWAAGEPLTPAQVLRAVGGALAYNTVHTILTRLCEKGEVQRDHHSTRTTYSAARPAAQHAAAQMHGLLTAAQADRAAILQQFVSALTPADEAALRAMLDNKH
jgi:predicted transcriptional regulator